MTFLSTVPFGATKIPFTFLSTIAVRATKIQSTERADIPFDRRFQRYKTLSTLRADIH